jgi:hypothetical protein
MTAAIHELRDHPNAKSSLELQIFGDANEYDLAALQSIYQYLEEKGLTYTLGCLIEEAGVQKEDNAYDLIGLLDDSNEEEEDVSGFNSAAPVVDTREWRRHTET